jgi:hypothetical protein
MYIYIHLGNWGDAGQLTKWGIFAGGAGYILGRLCIFVNSSEYIYTYIYAYICIYMYYVDISIYLHECIHIYTYICTYIYIYNLSNGGYSQEGLDIS